MVGPLNNAVTQTPAVVRQPKQARARATRQKLLAATLTVLEQQGIERVSTNQIALRAGVNIASLYKYFPDKYAILKELALEFSRKQTDLICQYLHAAPLDAPLESVCHGLVDALINGTRHDRALVQLQRSLLVIPELHSAYRLSNEEIGDAMKPFLKQWGIKLSPARLKVAMICLGETCGALQDLALSRDERYDPAVIAELKFVLTAYYEQQRTSAKG